MPTREQVYADLTHIQNDCLESLKKTDAPTVRNLFRMVGMLATIMLEAFELENGPDPAIAEETITPADYGRAQVSEITPTSDPGNGEKIELQSGEGRTIDPNDLPVVRDRVL